MAELVAARTVDQTQAKLNRAMLLVNNWMESHGLTLAFSKTESVALTKKTIPTTLPERVGVKVVKSKSAVKYLGGRVLPYALPDCTQLFSLLPE